MGLIIGILLVACLGAYSLVRRPKKTDTLIEMRKLKRGDIFRHPKTDYVYKAIGFVTPELLACRRLQDGHRSLIEVKGFTYILS